MAATVDKLPIGFVPFETLTTCGNVMTNGKAPFAIGHTIPLLIGRNHRPQVWLSAPRDQMAREWIDLVSAGKALHPDVKVLFSEDNKEASVQIRRMPILEVKSGPTQAQITFLDLRPIGLNIFGDVNGLSFGPNRFSHNSFHDVPVMMTLGTG